MKWSDEEIEDFVRKRDKVGLVKISRRIPKNKLTTKMLALEVARETGFLKEDVEKVIRGFTTVLTRNIYEGNAVRIDNLATFWTYVKEGYATTGFKPIEKGVPGNERTSEQIYVQPRYKLKVKPNINLEDALRDKPVSKEEAYKLFDQKAFNKKIDKR